MAQPKTNHQKNICLINRSIYPHPISKHAQNMKTFEGWMRFWDGIVIISQSRYKEIKSSKHKRITGVLLPAKSNKYLNIFFFSIKGFFEINKLNKKYNFEVYQASDPGGAMLAFLMSKLYKKKFIMEIQGDIFNYPSKFGARFHTKIVKLFSKFFVKKADFIRIVSPFLFEPLKKLNIDRDKIFLVPARCDSELFSLDNVNSIKPKIFNNEFNLLFVGNLLLSKGVDTLLEAFLLIEKENSNIGLIFVGDGEEKERLLFRSRELGVENKVKFLGRVSYEEIPTLMYYSDILILPSVHEGFGRVLLEAMSMHLPIIASNVGGIPLVIDNGKDGLLFEAGDFNSLRSKVLFLIKNKSFASKMTNAAHKKFITNYEYEVSINMFLDMYKSILK
jgi:glycosyltransferase involved in cell wall biosynthesis